ncbi:MAG: hypothetical protein MSIBF_06130 [Candidatus Altiarchaeales archaeon IMC4]|nr:MAG: hypothetical protein MSIBF_06130 [Candidatus Altiarchaeales archaeon IMC4]
MGNIQKNSFLFLLFNHLKTEDLFVGGWVRVCVVWGGGSPSAYSLAKALYEATRVAGDAVPSTKGVC